MSEVREFSIDPYIDGGGIMGRYLQVNPDAASYVMDRTQLTRDVLVLREANSGIDYYAQGRVELALLGAGVSTQKDNIKGTSSASTLRRTDDKWIIGVDDKKIFDSADKWMDTNFRKHGIEGSGQEVFKNRFVLELNKEVAVNVRNASNTEKNDWLKATAVIAAIDDVLLGIGLGLGYVGINLVSHSAVNILQDGVDGGRVINAGAGLVLTRIAGKAGKKGVAVVGWMKKTSAMMGAELSPYEYFVPNPKLIARTQAKRAIDKKGIKMIELKQE